MERLMRISSIMLSARVLGQAQCTDVRLLAGRGRGQGRAGLGSNRSWHTIHYSRWITPSGPTGRLSVCPTDRPTD